MRPASQSRRIRTTDSVARIRFACTGTHDSLDLHNYSHGRVISGEPLRYDLPFPWMETRPPQTVSHSRNIRGIKCKRTGAMNPVDRAGVWVLCRVSRHLSHRRCVSRKEFVLCCRFNPYNLIPCLILQPILGHACDGSLCPFERGYTL